MLGSVHQAAVRSGDDVIEGRRSLRALDVDEADIDADAAFALFRGRAFASQLIAETAVPSCVRAWPVRYMRRVPNAAYVHALLRHDMGHKHLANSCAHRSPECRGRMVNVMR